MSLTRRLPCKIDIFRAAIRCCSANSILSPSFVAMPPSKTTRLKSIKNIGKITSSMKMIASTKLNRAQKAMEIGRTYGEASQATLKYLGVEETPLMGEQLHSGAAQMPKMEEGQKHLILACSSDRGLCGAIHSSVSKIARLAARTSPSTTAIAVLGDKSKPQIARDARKNIILSFSGVGKNVPTMLDSISILQTIKEAGGLEAKPSRVSIIYNRFRSVIAYEPILVSVPTLADLKASPKLSAYEFEDEALENYAEFLLVSRLTWALVEGYASEMSAKRTAMENASKNAGEIAEGLLMKYNRTRQSVITNELVDIITGASAL